MPKRSLMLAGGGLKIAFQAGVLQVWLDEAGIEFDHADGVSAACFNLAMWAQGMTGTQIADCWRKFRPVAAVKLSFTSPTTAVIQPESTARKPSGSLNRQWPKPQGLRAVLSGLQ